MTVIQIRYRSVNCYFIDMGKGLLAFDAGWPNTYRDYIDALKERGYSAKDIRRLIVSHFHMDHAGLAGQLTDNSVEFVIFKNQVDAVAEMEALIERQNIPYRKLDLSKVRVMDAGDSRGWLAQIGIPGEVGITPGHGGGSVSLVLDSGEAFIGDLPPGNLIAEDDLPGQRSWALLRAKGARHIYPAHAGEYMLV